ncbi:uncharacterized protein MYCFIDRAFT_80362 [Pseudocercospora fijiensis CIRAD86]|uniref:Allantoin permease n=1 Tax=Pseudocercospora fijiensis (strain CIRAD86) TaxID=383855 RepID=M3ADZ1_PSEFD|nr:uncharacterized protein MYCFIDRAFT_80362 [Pseudocercospora fijiensis CIRAD86]EME82746.1 hypothetical protein MYCFIDRAFT_80362 [Pseudocercospora fijiensis CIRAD86]
MPFFPSKLRAIAELQKEERGDHEAKPSCGKWSNVDLEPTPPERRNWSPFYYFAFQFSIAFSPTTYNIGSTLFSIGLTWWTIIDAAFVGTFLCCLVLFFNSRGPIFYHVGFPLYARISAGIYGSLCSWENIPNHLPSSAGITTPPILAFFLTWLLQFPFAWLHPSKAGPLFVVKSVLSPIAYIATMIWALVKFNGVELNLGKTETTGSALGGAFMRAINTVVSGVVPPMVNIADLARYGNRPRDIVPLTIGLFLSKPAVILLGLFTTAAGAKHFGVADWNLWDLYGRVLDEFWGPGARTLVFLGAFIQCFATIVRNVSSNAIPVGCDLSGLFPKYFTIVRGMVLCHVLVWPVVPWLLVNSAKNFLTFLGSYLCLITPVVAVMIVDYWISRRGNLHVPSLYRPESGSPYYYTRGFNIRAYVAWAVGVVLVISGISGAIKPGSVSQTVVNVDNCGFILSFTGAAVTYYILCLIWPVQVYPRGPHENESKEWEVMVPTEGFFSDGSPLPDYIRSNMLYGEEVMPTAVEAEPNLKGEKL